MFVIFGSSGYIGTHLVNYLLSKGESVIGISRTEPKIFHNKELFKFVKHDLLYPIRREDIIEDYDEPIYFIDTAAYVNAMSNSPSTITNNSIITSNVLNVLKEGDSYVHLSSLFAGRGSIYAQSKKVSDDIIEEFQKFINANMCILKISYPFGAVYALPNKDTVIGKLYYGNLTKVFKQAKGGYTYIMDICKTCEELCIKNVRGKYYILNSNSIVLSDVCKLYEEANTSCKIEYEIIDNPKFKSAIIIDCQEYPIEYTTNSDSKYWFNVFT